MRIVLTHRVQDGAKKDQADYLLSSISHYHNNIMYFRIQKIINGAFQNSGLSQEHELLWFAMRLDSPVARITADINVPLNLSQCVEF